MSNLVLPQNLLSAAGAVVEGFEADSDWTPVNCTLADDTTDFLQGTQSVKMIPAEGATCTMTKTVSLDLSTLSAHTRLSFFIVNQSNLTSVTLFISSTADLSKSFSVTKTGGFRAGWNVFDIALADWTNTGAESWANTMIRIRCQVVTPANKHTNVSFDNLLMGFTAIPAVWISFDDGYDSIYAHALPVMKRYGIRGTMYATTSRIGTHNWLTLGELLAMRDAGWSICQHTSGHVDLNALTYTAARAELNLAKSELAALGLSDTLEDMALALGAGGRDGPYKSTRAAMTAAGIVSGRTVDDRFVQVLPFPDPLQLSGYMVEYTDTLATVEGWIDTAYTNGRLLPLVFHKLVSAPVAATEWGIDDFAALMAYIYGKGMAALTITDLRTLQAGEAVIPQALPAEVLVPRSGVALEIYDSDGVTFLDRSGMPLRAALVWPLNAVGSMSVDLAAVDPVIASLDVGHVVKLRGPEGILFVGTVRDIPGIRLLNNEPTFSLEVLNSFDDLNMKTTMRRWWDDPGYATGAILSEHTHAGVPPGYAGADGMLYGTAWELDIEVGVSNRVRVGEYLWQPLLRAIVQTIEAAAAAWWADPIALTLYVGEFGADSGIVVCRPDGPDPLFTRDAGVLWATRISKEVQGPIANRIYGIGAELDDDPFRVILPYPKPGWGAYTVVEVAGQMSGQLEYYIEDAASVLAYGVIEYGLVDRSIGIIGVTYAGAQLRLYGLTESALKRWKDKVRFYNVDCIGNRIDSLGRATVTPGSKVRLVYRGYVERTHPVTGDSLGVTYEDVNELLFVTSLERNWNSRGVEMVRLQLADSLQLAPVVKSPIIPGVVPPIDHLAPPGDDTRGPGW